MALVMTAAPAAEPIDLAEAKAHLRIDGSDEDSLLTAAGAKATLAARDADSPLSRSIEVIDVSEGDSLAFAVGTEEPVGHFLEFGTTRMLPGSVPRSTPVHRALTIPLEN